MLFFVDRIFNCWGYRCFMFRWVEIWNHLLLYSNMIFLYLCFTILIFICTQRFNLSLNKYFSSNLWFDNRNYNTACHCIIDICGNRKFHFFLTYVIFLLRNIYICMYIFSCITLLFNICTLLFNQYINLFL